jgi:hypothetical protein
VSTSKTQHYRARKLLMAALPDRCDFADDEPTSFAQERALGENGE